MALSHTRICAPTTDIRPILFRHLSPQSLAELDAISSAAAYPAGTVLMRQGDTPNCVSILLHGRVKIYTSSQEGKSLLLKIAGEGAACGLASVVAGLPYETTVEAYAPCTVQAIRSKDFHAFLFRHNAVCWQALQIIAEENHELLVNARRVALSGSVAGNLARLLLDWETTLQQSNGGKHFNLLLTHQEIAEMVGTARETVTRTLVHFRQSGWIRVQGVSIEVLQREQLENISI